MARKSTSPPPSGAVAAVNIYGPEGDFCAMGQPLPSSWGYDFVNELLETGGAIVKENEE